MGALVGYHTANQWAAPSDSGDYWVHGVTCSCGWESFKEHTPSDAMDQWRQHTFGRR